MQKKIIRHLNLLCVLVFLAAQALSFAHIADHGVGEHYHHGAICDVYCHYDNMAYGAADDVLTLHSTHMIDRLNVRYHESLYQTSDHNFSARAPPVIS